MISEYTHPPSIFDVGCSMFGVFQFDTLERLIPLVASVATIFSAVAGLLIIYLTVRKSALERQLRRRTQDCLGFWHIEKRLCHWISYGENDDLKAHTPDGIKRLVRSAVRLDNIRTPSADANPEKLNQDLAKLR